MTNYIYTLSDPRTDTVRYVGRSVNPESRFKAHLRVEYSNYRSQKEQWVAELSAVGLLPVMTIIDSSDDSVIIRQKEQYWINKYTAEGCNLLNKTGAFLSNYMFKIPLPLFYKLRDLAETHQMDFNQVVCKLIENAEVEAPKIRVKIEKDMVPA